MSKRNTTDGCEYGDIGQELNLSKETVRQIEKRALVKMRKILKGKGLTVEHFFEAVQQRSRQS